MLSEHSQSFMNQINQTELWSLFLKHADSFQLKS